MAGDPRLGTQARKRILTHWRQQAHPWCQHPTCLRPGQPIDYTAARGQALALEVDEITPRWQGGDPLDLANTRPAHCVCNRTAGTRVLNALRRARSTQPQPTEQW
jgi:hypothetical protein